MFETTAAGLVGLWLIAMVTRYTLHGFVHLLLVGAIVVLMRRMTRERSPTI